MNSDDLPPSTATFGRDYDLYSGLSEAELRRLADFAKLRTRPPQQYLFTQHTPADRVFNLASGAALVERMSTSGRRQVLAFLFSGNFVGLTNSDFCEYGVRTLTEVTAHEFNQQKLLALAETTPRLKENINNISANVLARALDQVYILGQKKADERLCFLILQLLERMPGSTEERIELPMTQQDIADYLGLTVETVSRSLTKLKNEGIITMPSRHRLKVNDMEAVMDRGDIR